MKEAPVNVGLRIAGGLLDNFIFSFAMFMILAPFMIVSMLESLHEDTFPAPVSVTGFIVFAVCYALYFNRDIFNGRSPAKRIVNTQVVDFKTGLPAGPMKCMIRNLPLVFWPMEAIALLMNPSRRVGDYLAGTKVVAVKNPQRIAQKVGETLLALLIALVICVLLVLPFYYIFDLAISHNRELFQELHRH